MPGKNTGTKDILAHGLSTAVIAAVIFTAAALLISLFAVKVPKGGRCGLTSVRV